MPFKLVTSQERHAAQASMSKIITGMLMTRVLELWVLVVLIASPAFAGDAAVPQGYKLQPGDVLQVNVWKETELQSEVLIRPDGGISFALAGDLQAAGLTTDELRGQLELRVRRLVPGAVVTVSVKAPNGNRIFVIGKVSH